MARRNIAVLDFGTSRVSVMIGDRGINNAFDIKGYGETNYAGFMDGDFLQPETLMQDVQEALACAENNARCKITNLYVGVPAEFSSVIVKKGKLNFGKPHRINDKDIQDLFDSVDDLHNLADNEVINRAPVYYILDDDCKIIEPKGKVSEEISGTISFVLSEKTFLNKVKQILAPLHIQSIEFFSEPLSECLYLVPPEQRDGCAVLVDCGFLTTSVSIVMGDGLLSLNSFSLGSGHIIADFSDIFGLNIEQAERLKRKISLNDIPEAVNIIELDGKQGIHTINEKQAYQIVEYRIKQIAKMIKKCLNMYSTDLPNYLPVFITGGGISHIQGMQEIMKTELGRSVEVVRPEDPELNQPQLSSSLSLLDLALKQNKQKNSFFIRLFKKN